MRAGLVPRHMDRHCRLTMLMTDRVAWPLV